MFRGLPSSIAGITAPVNWEGKHKLWWRENNRRTFSQFPWNPRHQKTLHRFVYVLKNNLQYNQYVRSRNYSWAPQLRPSMVLPKPSIHSEMVFLGSIAWNLPTLLPTFPILIITVVSVIRWSQSEVPLCVLRWLRISALSICRTTESFGIILVQWHDERAKHTTAHGHKPKPENEGSLTLEACSSQRWQRWLPVMERCLPWCINTTHQYLLTGTLCLGTGNRIYYTN